MITLAWKPYGITSNDFAYQQKTYLQVDKLCYAGRLDPMAQGQMLLLCDEKVKDMDLYLSHDKSYTFDMIFGLSTDSLDPYGKISSYCQVNPTDKGRIMNRLPKFIESYTEQIYPMKSSYVIRHHGVRKPLWWYYDQNIVVPHEQVPKKKVSIYSYNIYTIDAVPSSEVVDTMKKRMKKVTNPKTMKDLHLEDVESQYNSISDVMWIKATMALSVSSGFYIRQFCHDFGKYISIPCVAMDITRTNIFKVSNKI